MKKRTNKLFYDESPTGESVRPWVESFLGDLFIRWSDTDPNKGYLTCPSERLTPKLHTEKTGPKDTAIFVGGRYPVITCFHQSCRCVIDQANESLREGIKAMPGFKPKPLTAEEKARRIKLQGLDREKERLAKHRDWIFQNYKWPVAEIKADSAVIKDPWLEYLHLWEPSDVIWSGERFHSSKPKHREHFKTARQWAEIGAPQYPLVSSSAFEPDCYERSKDKIIARRFLPVECDELDADPAKNKDMSGTILRWLIEEKKWRLACVVDSGGKSIHGHFYIDSIDTDWAEKCLPALGVDPGPLRAAQPVRAPSFIRDNGREQELIWKQ